MPKNEPSVKEFLMSLMKNPAIKDMSPKEVVRLARECHYEYVRPNGQPDEGYGCDRTALTVSVLNLSKRPRSALDRNHIDTLGELTKHTERDLLGLENFGINSLDEIKSKLKKMGLSLSGPKSPPLRECRTCQGDCPVKALVPQPHAPVPQPHATSAATP